MTDSSKPPLGRRMKTHAPPPPQAPQPAPRHIFRNTVPDRGGTSGVDSKENVLSPKVDLQLTLPQGNQISVTEDGGKALMDLLVELCSRYHLNPALHTLELLSAEGHPLGFKPNALLGSLNVACVLIKEKVWEEKVVRKPAPKVPEKTVRLMVNYYSSQKAVVRVNPFLPLQVLLPVICKKCDFDPEHVLLLKDSISRHELPLDKSLTDLGIKELYVHDQSLVLQPKMASAPVLNYSDSISSSTSTLGRPEKKGLFGIFQFSRRKSKSDSTSMDMDDYDDKLIQNTDKQSNCLSTVSGVHSVEHQHITLGQSQSVTNIPRMSPKAETKKRRAPAPPGALPSIIGQTSFEGHQIGLGSESQQRKRKAPAPPPTPASITPGSDDTSVSAATTAGSTSTKEPTPAFTRVTESLPVSSIFVVTQTVNPVFLKTEVQPPAVCHATTTASSPTPSSSTTDSLVLNDSSSELSHSLEDSDADLDQASSHSNTLTSRSGSDSQPSVKMSSSRMEEVEKSSSTVAKFNPETTSASSSRSETESALNLKLEEAENNRHSAIGTTDQPTPLKPPHFPALEPPQLVQTPTPPASPPASPPIEPAERPMELKEEAPDSWLHSVQCSKTSGKKPETETLEEENVSMGSNGSSLPDQGYAASEGMAEGDDSGMVLSPSDTQPTFTEESLSLGGSSRDREKQLEPVQDNSSDSDEGCATWGSRHRNNEISSKAKTSRSKGNYEDAQFHETLAAGVIDHIDIVSMKKTPYTMSTDSNEVPVSVVDIDVPVTAIDDVLEEYEHNTVETEAKAITRIESTSSKDLDLCHHPSMEPQNKNNNACTASESNKRCSTDTKQMYQPEQHMKSELKSEDVQDKKGEKIIQQKIQTMRVSDTKGKGSKQKTSAVKSNEEGKQSENTQARHEPIKSNTQSSQEMKPDATPATQRSVSTERSEEMQRVFPNNTSSNSVTNGKITRVTSRFGMRTFTVVPPKPSVTHSGTVESAGTLTSGAIKIDDQGNMVKEAIFQSKADDSFKSESNSKEETLLLGKAKAFWNSQENAVPNSKGPIDRAKENTDGLKSAPTAVTENLSKTCNADNRKTETVLPEQILKEEAKDLVEDIQVKKEKEAEMESKVSVSKNVQSSSNKPVLPPPLPKDFKKDMFFLKPSRRTSSQYVASAITRNTPKTVGKPNSNIPESSTFIKTHAVRSMQANSHQPFQSFLSNNKEIDLVSKPNPPGPKMSVSHPEYVSDSQRDFGEVKLERERFESCVGSIKGSSDVLKTAKNKHTESSDPIKTNMTANDDKDNIKHIRPTTPTQSSLLHASTRLYTTPKIINQGQTRDKKDMTLTDPFVTPDVKPPPSVTVPDSAVTPGPPPVTVFGPVKKFRPVIAGPVAKETSLHSSLMEAIQKGKGRDGLKKVSISGSSNVKKTSHVEDQNERSALMAAIRAQSNTDRLRKTKSGAADELEKFRKAAFKEERSADPPSSYSPPPSTSPTVLILVPPSLPPTPVGAPPPPPPPPPVLLKGKPVTESSANTPMNPALAREAMLEAIRSGSAAEKLKKVTLPTKTVQVNGRLGTIQLNSSSLSQQ